MISEMDALLAQILCPFIVHLPLSFLAFVSIMLISDPAFGSVSEKHEIYSPEISLFKYFVLMFSDP